MLHRTLRERFSLQTIKNIIMNLRFEMINSCCVELSLTFREYFKCLIQRDDFIDFLFIQFDRIEFRKCVIQMRKAKNDWDCKKRTYIDAKNANSSFSILTKFCRRIRSIIMMKQSISSAWIRSFWLINDFFSWFDDFFDLTNTCFFLINKHVFSKSCYLSSSHCSKLTKNTSL